MRNSRNLVRNNHGDQLYIDFDFPNLGMARAMFMGQFEKKIIFLCLRSQFENLTM